MKTASERLAKRRKICPQYLIRWVGRKTHIILLYSDLDLNIASGYISTVSRNKKNNSIQQWIYLSNWLDFSNTQG
jgi:hypothetical protein